ncbi:MAG: polysaccharide deacetylase family protein [Polyangiaceae bacterium]
MNTNVTITVDVEGDFGGSELRGVDEALPRLCDKLDELGARAVFFWVGDVARQRPHLVRELASRGHTLGSHTMSHPALSHLAPERRRRELYDARVLVEDLASAPCVFFRAPFFDAPRGLGRWLEESGYRFSSSKAPFSIVSKYRNVFETKPHALDDTSVRELPVPGVLGLPIPEGLSYRRLFFPLPMLQQRPPRVFYLHPYDLLDQDASGAAARRYGRLAERLMTVRSGAWSRSYFDRLLTRWRSQGARLEPALDDAIG